MPTCPHCGSTDLADIDDMPQDVPPPAKDSGCRDCGAEFNLDELVPDAGETVD